GRHLGVELETEALPRDERLGTHVRLGDEGRAGRQREGVEMPLEPRALGYEGRVGRPDREPAALGAAREVRREPERAGARRGVREDEGTQAARSGRTHGADPLDARAESSFPASSATRRTLAANRSTISSSSSSVVVNGGANSVWSPA